MVLGLMLGCEVEVVGLVAEPSGARVGGAVLDAAGKCSAISAEDGSFRTRCARGDYHFLVTHPGYSASTLHVDATGSFPPHAVKATLTPWPEEPGLYLEPEYSRLMPTPLVRTVEKAEQRFCLAEGTTLPLVAADPTLFDVHAVDWRLYALDAEGCAFRLTSAVGSRYWAPVATKLDPTETKPLALGRERVEFTIGPGRYVAVAWLDGFLVPDDAAVDTWVAWGFKVGTAIP